MIVRQRLIVCLVFSSSTPSTGRELPPKEY